MSKVQAAIDPGAVIPPMDRSKPAELDTATFAMG